jgi:hypothetical protein
MRIPAGATAAVPPAALWPWAAPIKPSQPANSKQKRFMRKAKSVILKQQIKQVSCCREVR